MSKRLLTIALFAIIGSVQTSFAQGSSFAQRCRFILHGAEHKTDQRDAGDLFHLENLQTQYITKDAALSSADELTQITVTVLSEQDGPSMSIDDTTEAWLHAERVVVRSITAKAKAHLKFALLVGTELNLSCRNSESTRN